jgi:four helix bundle protein
MKDFKDLDVWKASKQLAVIFYKNTENFPKHELFGLTNQMRRAAISISSNIAEGCGRKTAKDTTQFLYISRGSLFELESQLIIAFELNYILQEPYDQLNEQIIKCRQLINGFINYYENRQ